VAKVDVANKNENLIKVITVEIRQDYRLKR